MARRGETLGSASGDPPNGPAWHALAPTEALARLGSDANRGLSEAEVARRIQRHGPNRVTARHGPSAIARFLAGFHSGLVYILLAAGAITLLFGEWVDSGVIFGVVLVNATIGFVQETRALKAIAALARTLSAEATVLRDAARRRVDSEMLVPGDVVVLGAGDKVPADVRLIEARDVAIDESALTGESAPIHKSTEALAADALLADRRNMAFASSLVTRGQGVGVVIGTGDDTEVGRISGLLSRADDLATPLTRKLEQFSRWLLVAILAVSAAIFAVGLARGHPLVDTFMVAVALAVGAIPEGLPAAMTIMLAVGVSRMAERRAIVRKLPAVEALGSTTVICSDKTGTLTENQMTVQTILAGGELFEVEGVGYDPAGTIRAGGETVDVADRASLRACLVVGALCNDARLRRVDGRWTIEGDPTEGALLVAAAKGGLEPIELERRHRRIDVIPFDADAQFMATLHGDGDRAFVAVKGSVERILSMCRDALDAEGRSAPLDAAAIHAAADSLGRRGLRVLALARAERSSDAGPFTAAALAGARSALSFVGLQGMQDPPRPEAIRAVGLCRRAGVAVTMITGDHAGTARAIAERIGLGPGGRTDPIDEHSPVVTGRELASIRDDELPEVAQRTHVFARMTPEEKLRLVRALQSRGHVVAMTGDGVNDAPALRQADIGIAMGITGTEVAKEAADIVLADDNFASIEAAVEEGRAVFDNLTKFLVWILPTNGGVALIIMAAMVFGTPLPILPVQALYINMTSAILLGLTLVFEPKERDLMERPPRDPHQPILTFELVMRTGLMSLLLLVGGFGLFEWAEWRGLGDAEARTLVVSLVILAESCYLFNCRSLVRSVRSVGWFTNPYLWCGVTAMVAIQIAFVHVPFLNRLFHSAPLGASEWLAVTAASLLIGVVVGLEKAIRRRVDAGRANDPSRGTLRA